MIVMSNEQIYVFIIIGLLVMIVVLLLNNRKARPGRSSEMGTETLVKVLEAKLSGQTSILNSANQTQKQVIKDEVARIDSNMLKTNSQIAQMIRNLFEDIDNKQHAQNRKNEEKNIQFEKQLVKISTLDESLSMLQERVVDLSMILANSKARGTFGELSLYQLIDDYFGVNNDLVAKQCQLSNGKIVDLVINNRALDLKICIDSKFPLENYLEFNETGEQGFKTLFERDIKKHTDDIKNKYIIEGETSNFAIMFIPSEAIYLEIMANPKLATYSYKQKVWLTSPTTILALVTMLENINIDYLRMENINLIERELGKLSLEFDRFNDRHDKLATHLKQTTKDLESIDITRNKLIKRFEAVKKMEMEGGVDEYE